MTINSAISEIAKKLGLIMKKTSLYLCLLGFFLQGCGTTPTYYEISMAEPAVVDMAPIQPANDNKFKHYEESGYLSAQVNPVSTFSIDVDTGSYSIARRFLNMGQLPPAESVRIEEMVNYFNYDYATPTSLDQPFNVITEVGPAPWDNSSHLLHIGLKGYEIDKADRPNANLVFLIDVSGSMEGEDRLELVKRSLSTLTKQLDKNDSVAIVVYAGAAGVVLPPTSGDRTLEITRSLRRLSAGGSTNGGEGIQLAYQLARQAFISEGINRVILCTDGDLNVGMTNHNQLMSLIESYREKGVSLTTLGFGMGNFNDHLMEQLADKGNGHYAYIDNFKEARKVLSEQVNSTLLTIAKDVKIQVEFNPAKVSEYRLIGYANRRLKREDFNNDRVDAGDIGAGHTVTALYEIKLAGSASATSDPLRYKDSSISTKPDSSSDLSLNQELAYIKLRYKKPEEQQSRLLSQAIYQSDLKQDANVLSQNFQFSAAVAAFGQKLMHSKYDNYSYGDILTLAKSGLGNDDYGHRKEFVSLVRAANELDVLR